MLPFRSSKSSRTFKNILEPFEIFKTLEEEIKSELSGHFKDCALALLMPTDEYEASSLYHAMKGLGTDEHLLIEILCTKDAHEIKNLRDTYTKSKLK